MIDELRERIARVVAAGDDVRGRVAEHVAAAAEHFHGRDEGLTGLAGAVLHGAAEATREAGSEQATERFQQVVDGLSDGLHRAATAARFTFEEARSSGQRFAREEVEKLADDLQDLADRFVGMVQHRVEDVFRASADQIRRLRDHATRALEAMRPGLEAARDAARGHLTALAAGAARTGAAAGRRAAGSLFSLLGRSIQRAGEHLKGPPSGGRGPAGGA